MANISGSVWYDALRQAQKGTAIAQVPVVLYQESTHLGVVALTDSSGAFLFTNVPDGQYHLMEAWGEPGGTSQADWNEAAAMDRPEPKDPPAKEVKAAQGWANRLDSLTPNTIVITVEGENPAPQEFYDGPTEDRPLHLTGGLLAGTNLIAGVDGGTFGKWEDGTPSGTIPWPNPYPQALKGIPYSQTLPPESGKATLCNITGDVPGWWGTTNHTTGCENGRMLVINEAEQGTVVFQQMVSVLPDSSYVFSAWVAGLLSDSQVDDTAGLKLRIQVTAPDGTSVLDYRFQPIPAADLSQWTQLGALFDSGPFMHLYLELSAEGDFKSNTFALDDICVMPVVKDRLLSITQEADQQSAQVGDTVEYTVTVQNTSDYSLEQVSFQAEMPVGLAFVPDSLTVNGREEATESDDLNNPLDLGDLLPGEAKRICYQAQVQSLSAGQMQQCAGEASYLFLKSASGDLFYHTEHSNAVCLNKPDCLRDKALTQLVKAMAMQQQAIAKILQAEGEKIKAVMQIPGDAPEEIVRLDSSMLDAAQCLTDLQAILHQNITQDVQKTVEDIQ
nr:hypothetical protein [uncultured Solibaculum sp.]